MKKFLAILVLVATATLLNSCGAGTVSDQFENFRYQNPKHSYHVLACSKSRGGSSSCGMGASLTQSSAENSALGLCREDNSDCVIFKINDRTVNTRTASSYSSGSTSYGSSYSGSSSTQISQLYYDAQTGGMRQCLHDPGATGKCLAFAPTLKQYYTNTLFYNPKTGAMQPCLHATSMGQCQSFGVFNHSAVSKGQLFYDPKNKKMTTCLHVTVSGNCAHYELVPNSYAKNYGGFRMTPNPSNPYYKRVPRSNQSLIDSGMRMLGGGCTLGINC